MAHDAHISPSGPDDREAGEGCARRNASVHPACVAGPIAMSPEENVSSDDHVIDRAAVFERFEGDIELLREIAELFLEMCPVRLQAIRDALARGDSKALQFAAHSLKGAVSNFAAEAARAAALRLELIGRAGDLAEANEAFDELDEAVARLCGELRHLKDDFEPH